MKKIRALTVLALAMLAFAASDQVGFAQATGKLVAVLELNNKAGVTDDEADFLTNKVRNAASELLPPGKFTILTRENIETLLPPGMDLKKCTESKCEIEMGRKLGAEYIVTGEILKFGGDLRIQISVHHVPSGNFLGSRDTGAAPLNKQEPQLLVAAGEVMGLILRHAGVKAPGGGRTIDEGKIGQQPGAAWDADAGETTVVRFESDPAGAVVMMDGALLCQTTPCSRELTPGGTPSISMQKERYQPRQEAIAVQKGLAVTWKLAPNFGWLSVTSNPAGLAVKVNGKELGKTPLTNHELDPGPYEVVVSDPRYYDQGEKFNLTAGQQKAVSVTMPPREGAFKISARDQHDNALEGEIYLDGVKVGAAPGTFKALVGQHNVEVRTPQGNWTGAVEAKEHQVTPVTAEVKVASRPTAPASTAAAGSGSTAGMDHRQPIAVPLFLNIGTDPDNLGLTQRLSDQVADDMRMTGLLDVIDRALYVENLHTAGLKKDEVDFRSWSDIGAKYLIKGGFKFEADALTLEFRLFNVSTKIMILGRMYTGKPEDWAVMAHNFANDAAHELKAENARHNEDVFHKAYASYQRGTFEDAKIRFREFLAATNKTDPMRDKAQFYLAEILFKQKNWDEAILAFDTLVADFPQTSYVATAYLDLGLAFQDKGQPKEAKGFFQKVVQQFPLSKESEIARKRLNIEDVFDQACAFYEQGNFEGAKDLFRYFLKTSETSSKCGEAQFYLADSLFKQGNWADSILEFDTLIHKYPQSTHLAEAYLDTAVAFEQKGDLASAKLFYETVVQRFPNAKEAGIARKKLRAMK
jgi:TolA-binding protein